MNYSFATLSTEEGPQPVVKLADQYYPLDRLVSGLVIDRERGLLDLFRDWERNDRATRFGYYWLG